MSRSARVEDILIGYPAANTGVGNQAVSPITTALPAPDGHWKMRIQTKTSPAPGRLVQSG